ncbi:hypothetical protein GALL_108540 [mine drainage metagenome]|uniref:Outer membrane protein beta-barrel domain-containing protein n=1 Tax=mine drainage metagenome TaxID=410659 RepID=A0A1J5SZC3_9ZZZZ
MVNTTKAQTYFGIKKINVWADFAFAKPKDELKNYYGLGNAMQLYYGVDVPFAFFQYNKKSNTGLSIAGFLDHEKGNFSSGNYATDGLDAKLTSVGVRVRPFANMAIYAPKGNVTKGYMVTETLHKVEGRDEFGKKNYREYTTTERMPIWGDEGAKLLFTMFLSGLYFDYGVTHAALIEKPTPDVFRTATMFSYGWAPAIGVGQKTTFYIDFGIRKYSWTNGLNTKSSIGSFHCGFGLGFRL